MQMTKRNSAIAAGTALIIIIVAFVWFTPAKAPSMTSPAVVSEVASPGQPAAPSPSQDKPSASEPRPFTLTAPPAITSWSFKGAYTGNDTLVRKANDEIARLAALVGKGKYPDYVLYVSIANQYDLLGDGKSEFTFLTEAIALDSTKTGLALYNAGQLLTRFGAYADARKAFEQAVAAEPVSQYRQALADFLAAHYPQEARN